MTAPMEQASSGNATASSSNAGNTTTSQFLEQNLCGENALPPALAVIASLTSILEAHVLPTLAETLDLLSLLSKALKNEFSHGGAEPLLAVPVSAGLEVFQKWLLSAGGSSSVSNVSTATSTPAALSRSNTGLLQQDSHATTTKTGAGPSEVDFRKNRAAFLSQARSFVEEGIHAKAKIAASARRIFRDGATVLVPAYDEVVEEVIALAAAEQHAQTDSSKSSSNSLPGARFSVIIVSSPSASSSTSSNFQQTLLGMVQRLRKLQVPTAIINSVSIAHHLSLLPPATARHLIVLTGASALLSNGGILAPRGTQQACMVARAVLSHRVEVWVVAEQWKSVRWFPAQDLKRRGWLKFSYTAAAADGGGVENEQGSAAASTKGADQGEMAAGAENNTDALDITPPESITGFVTDRGVLTPSALAEESIITWF